MNQSIGESFEEYSRKQHKDMESRQRLTQLLDEQLDLNEDLRTQNISLVENQRKLLQLLEMRDQIIGRINEGKPHNDTHNSTFEQSRLFNDTAAVRQRDSPQKNAADIDKDTDRSLELESLKATYEATKAANNSLESRITTLNALILQKDQEVEKARLYNAEVYQKMEEQHENDEREFLKLKEKLYGVTLELENRRKEIVALQQKSESLRQDQQHATKDKEERLMAEIDSSRRAKEKSVKECAAAISMNQQLTRQYQRKTSELEYTMQLNNADYEKRIEQLEESLANSLQEIKEKYHIINRYEEQSQLMKQQLNSRRQQCKKLSENLLQSQERLQTLQQESVREDQTVGELKEMINKIKKQMELQIRNNSNLRKQIIELQRQAKSRQDIEINESSKLEEMQLTIEQLQARNDRCKDDAEKTIEKLQRELERKDKQIADVKKSVKSLENQINTKQQTIQQLESKLSKITETAGMKEKKLKDQLQKALEETDKVRNENRNLKKELENMDARVRGILSGLEDRNLKLQNELHVSNNQSKHLQNDNEHLKRLYEKSELELSDARQTLQAKHRENQASRRRISDLEKELQQSKDQLKDFMEDTNKQEQLNQLRKELNQSKLRLASVTEANSKMKAQNTQLVRETISLNEFKSTVNGDLEKLKSQLKAAKQQKASLENKMNMLEKTLQEKNMQMEKSSPYITRLVEEKKILEVDNVKLKNQNNMYHHLLEVAKKSKADEILNLNNSITTLKKNQSKWQNELKEANKTIENNNREKVNMMRENTVREDHYVKIEKENKQLQDYNNQLLQQIKRLQNLFDQYQEHLQVAEKLANHFSESTQRQQERYEPVERRNNSRVAAEGSSKLDVSPIRSASNTKNHTGASEVTRSASHNTRSIVQQRIKSIEQDVLGRE